MEDVSRSWGQCLTTYVQAKVQGEACAKDIKSVTVRHDASHCALRASEEPHSLYP